MKVTGIKFHENRVSMCPVTMCPVTMCQVSMCLVSMCPVSMCPISKCPVVTRGHTYTQARTHARRIF